MSYLALVSNPDSRKTDILPANTIIEASEGIFTINERPVHCGGNAILYNAHKEGSNLDFVLKEYFPYNGFSRWNSLVVPRTFISSDTGCNLQNVQSEIQEIVLAEEKRSQLIYRYTARVAVNRTALHINKIIYPDGTVFGKPVGISDSWHFLLMDDLSQKGAFLTDIIAEAAYPNSAEHPFGNYEARPILGKSLPILDINVTLKIVSSVLEVLARIHEDAHFIHSDIQPNNILFEGADLKRGIVGHAMFLDFGSAHELQSNGTTEPLLATEVTGTPAFAPPELYNGQSISLTPAADIYSVGRLFLALIKPKTALSSLRATASSNISYTQLRIKPGEERASHCSPTLAKSINAILKKTLEPSPELRFQSAREMLEAIDSLTPRYSLPEGLSTPEFFIEHSRDEELDRLENALEDGMKPVWIWGFGGIGKTELANEFGRRCKQKNYKVAMFHFHESIQQTVLDLNISGYQYIAPYGLSSVEKQHAEYEDRLRVLNSFGSDMVLIMDNFDAENTRLIEIISSHDFNEFCHITPHILVTTRYNLSAVYPEYEIKPVADFRLLELFDRELISIDDNILLDIIHSVDCHTMTVSLIAKAMCDFLFPVDAATIIKALRTTHLPDISDSVVSDKDRLYKEQSIYSHLKTLFDISSLSCEARKILNYAVIIPVNGLDAHLFSDCLTASEKDALKIILGRGWLSCDKARTLHIHPLIRELCENELNPVEDDFHSFFTLMRQSKVINQISYDNRFPRILSFVRSIYDYSNKAHLYSSLSSRKNVWKYERVWRYIFRTLNEYGHYMSDPADYVLQQMPLDNDLRELSRCDQTCSLSHLFKDNPSLNTWMISFLSLHPDSTLSQAEAFIDIDLFDSSYYLYFREHLQESIDAKDKAINMLKSDDEKLRILLLHELSICSALDSSSPFKLTSQRFEDLIHHIEILEEKYPTRFSVLLSYELYNYAHFLALNADSSIRELANPLYQRALEIQLRVDENTPCSNRTCITKIVFEYEYYKENKGIKRGVTEFASPDINPPSCKKPFKYDDYDDYREYSKAYYAWAKYDRKIQVERGKVLETYLSHHSATTYLMSRIKKNLDTNSLPFTI